MANAKKCDRCGNLYDGNEIIKTNGKKHSVIGARIIANSPSAYIEYDLCNDCMKKLRDFMHPVKNNEE